MSIAELPAHNVIRGELRYGSGDAETVRVGGPECLATRDPSSYLRLHQNASATQPSAYVGIEDGTLDEVLGFGLWTPPSLATVITDIRFIAEGYIEGGATPVDLDDYFDTVGTEDQPYGDGSAQTNYPLVNQPWLLIQFGGDPFFFGGYNISTLPETTVGPAQCAVPLLTNLFGSDYVITNPDGSTIGSPDTGTDGLRPRLFIPTYPVPPPDKSIYLTYLAIQITYTDDSVVRQFPRDDEKGWGSAARIHPSPKANRIIGGTQ